MFIAVIFLGIIVVISITIWFYQTTSKQRKPSVFLLSINEVRPEMVYVLDKIIKSYVPDDAFIVIIQDDITFLDSHLYWPSKTAYVHFSDVKNFLLKHPANPSGYTFKEICSFIDNHVIIH